MEVEGRTVDPHTEVWIGFDNEGRYIYHVTSGTEDHLGYHFMDDIRNLGLGENTINFAVRLRDRQLIDTADLEIEVEDTPAFANPATSPPRSSNATPSQWPVVKDLHSGSNLVEDPLTHVEYVRTTASDASG